MPAPRVVLTFCLGVLFLLPVPVLAQWPTVLMFYGGPLKNPVFVTGADSVTVAPAFRPGSSTGPGGAENASTLNGRPFISVACFWGPPSNPAMNGVERLSDLKPEMATQHARFYPATASNAAAIFTTPMLFMKGRDLQGTLATAPGSVFTGNVQTKAMRGGPPPTQAEQYLATGVVSPAVIDAMKRLGIPVGL